MYIINNTREGKGGSVATIYSIKYYSFFLGQMLTTERGERLLYILIGSARKPSGLWRSRGTKGRSQETGRKDGFWSWIRVSGRLGTGNRGIESRSKVQEVPDQTLWSGRRREIWTFIGKTILGIWASFKLSKDLQKKA